MFVRGAAQQRFVDVAGRNWTSFVRWPLLHVLVVLLLLTSVAGCSALLSPPYDEATYQSLSDLNVNAETLFAAVAQGGTSSEFLDYKATYDQLIGGFSAVRIAVAARPVPDTSRRLFGNGRWKAACGSDIADCVNPTPHHLDKVIALLTAMRDAHRRGTLVSDLVAGANGQGGFKGQYEIEMSRVLVFESALQR